MLSDAVQKVVDLVDSIRFILSTRVRQRPRKIFGLIFRPIVLKDCGQFVHKVFLVQVVLDYVCSKNIVAP